MIREGNNLHIIMKRVILTLFMSIMILGGVINYKTITSHAGFLKPLEEYPGYMGTDEFGNTYWEGSGAWRDEYGRSGADLHHQDETWERDPNTVFCDGLHLFYSDGRVEFVDRSNNNTLIGSSKPKTAPEREHDYKNEVTKEPDCFNKGEMTYTCSKCNDTYTEEIDVNDNHDYVGEITKEAKCEVTGEKTFTCSRCGDAYVEDIPAITHEYSDEVTKETGCEISGIKTFTCRYCDDIYEEEIPAIGHDDGEWIVINEPKLFSKGLEKRYCTRCNNELEVREMESIYPIWYLYCGIGTVVLIMIMIGMIIFKKRNLSIELEENMENC